MTTASSSSSSGAGSQRGWWGRQESSSNNPVYNSFASMASTNPPASSSVYEELPHNQCTDQLPLTFSSQRTTTTNVLYASTGGKDLTPRKYPLEVYKSAPLHEPVYVDKKTKCTCSYEAAILILALLVILVAGAALVMSLLLWLPVIPLPARPTGGTPSSSPSMCSECDSELSIIIYHNYYTFVFADAKKKHLNTISIVTLLIWKVVYNKCLL